MAEQITVLMLDDDRLALNHFCRMADWAALGYAQPVCCTSFGQARAEIERGGFQVYILDIEVPGGNGLDFANEIHEKDRNAILLMLTSYREFTYAKRALSVGAFDYLVKHEITASAFADELQQIKERLDNRARHRLLMLQTSLCLLLSEETLPQQVRTCGELLEIAGEPLALFHVHPPFSFCLDASARPQTALELTEDELADQNRLACREGDSLWILLKAEDRSQLGEQARELSRMLTARLRTCEFSLSEAFTGAQQIMVWKKYFLCEEENRFFLNQPCTKRLITPCKLAGEEAEPDLQAVTDAWRRRDMDAVEQALRHAVAQISARQDRAGMLRHACEQWLALCGQQAEAQRFASVNELLFYLVDAFSSALQRHMRLDGMSAITKDIVEYVRRHPGTSQTELADALGKSVGYLRTNFKQDMRMTVADYILQCRVERAKALLQKRPVRIADIASELHYQSTQYFSVVFRKATGLTPMEYAQQYRREERP